MKIHTFFCSHCQQEKTHESDITTGYGTDNDGSKICFACCALRDQEKMDRTGKAVLYLDSKAVYLSAKERPTDPSAKWLYYTYGGKRKWVTVSKVSNWPGTLSYPVRYWTKGAHNLAGVRFDVWFTDHNGDEWHGVQYGENTQLCHCKRLKKSR